MAEAPAPEPPPAAPSADETRLGELSDEVQRLHEQGLDGQVPQAVQRAIQELPVLAGTAIADAGSPPVLAAAVVAILGEIQTRLWDVGDSLRAAGDLDSAQEICQFAQHVGDLLLAADPSGPRWRNDLAVSQDRLARVCDARGDSATALRLLTEARAAWEALVSEFPQDVLYTRNLALAHEYLGRLHEARRDPAAATADWRARRQVLQHLVALLPADLAAKHDLIAAHLQFSDRLVA